MIKLDRVEMADGTVYRNLYYGHDWEDLSFYSESDAPTILFYYRKGGQFEELELDTDKIVDIALGENEEGSSNFAMYYDHGHERFVLGNCEYDESWEADGFPYHPKLREVNELMEDLIIRVLDEYDLDDSYRFMITDNMVSIVLGYLETALDLDDDEEMTPEVVYANGFVISVLAASYACNKIENDKTKELLKNVADIVPEFAAYVEKNKDTIKIVYEKSDEDTQK